MQPIYGFLIVCQLLSSCGSTSPQQVVITATSTIAALPTPTATVDQATVALAQSPTSTYMPAINTAIPIRPITEYQGPAGRVTIDMPPGGRYVVVGDSMNFGSTFMGTNTYVDMCANRYPYAEQLFIETGIASTSSLDRGESMKTPFFSRRNALGQLEEFCLPADGVPTSNTVVPGSNTDEWINEHLANPVLVSALTDPNNRVVLLSIIADLFATKIDKPAVEPARYEQNLGKIVQQLSGYKKIIYLSQIPYVTTGSFIKADELNAINAQIESWNAVIRKMIQQNGYTDENGAFIGFGTQDIQQDGATIWIKTVQQGPDLDSISRTAMAPYYAKDGLHYHKEGYVIMGQSWAAALLAPVAAVQIKGN